MSRYDIAYDQFYQSFPALVLQATNIVVRRPGYEATYVVSDVNTRYSCKTVLKHLVTKWQNELSMVETTTVSLELNNYLTALIYVG